MSPDRYTFGDDARRESERLIAVQGAFDGVSQAALLEAGAQAGWHCWEVGAGRGSIARWLAATVGASGSVVATDLDERWFDAGPTTVRFVRHDVLGDPAPAQNLDLVHARFVLEHLDQPRRAIGRLVEALRPGGVLVVADAAGLQIDVTPPSPLFHRLSPAWQRAASAVGWDPAYGQRLLSDLRAAGLVDVVARPYRHRAPGGDAWSHLSYGIERLSGELMAQGIAQPELERAIECLADPANVITGPPLTIAWGRRAPAGN